ncbi:hypothetical protein D1872_73440 [compost metagenome]
MGKQEEVKQEVVEAAKETKEVVETKAAETQVSTQVEDVPLGFEDEEASDFIIPRVKVVNALSPERKEKIADEGDIINSLTKEKLNGKKFIPVYKFTNVILWKDRSEGGGIAAMSRDGKLMIPTDGSPAYPVGKLADFDNTKQGKDAIPTHVRYMNFFGFFEGERAPIILSFAKTNYQEGKRLFSLAKVTMQNMWNHAYTLNAKEMSKSGNDWFNIATAMAGATSEEDRAFGRQLFDLFRNQDVLFDVEDTTVDPTEVNAKDEDIQGTEF